MKNQDMGIIVRGKRTSMNMTLTELSNKTGLSIGYLSQFERGMTSITPDTLEKITTALDLDLTNDLKEIITNEGPVIRSYEREIQSMEGGTIIKYALTNSGSDKSLLPKLVVMLPQKNPEKIDCYAHSGQEFIYILEGVLTVDLNGTIYNLYPGDAAHFTSTVPHNWNNETNREVKFILVSLEKNPWE